LIPSRSGIVFRKSNVILFSAYPRPRLRRVGIFQRPIRVRDFYAVVIVDLIACGRGGIFKLRLCSRVLSKRQQPGNRERQKSEMHNSGNYVDTGEMSICFFTDRSRRE